MSDGRSAAVLEVRDVHRSYGAVAVVRGVSFTLRAGESCGYLGANGSGKTTTVRMLTGLLPPTRGVIYYDGHDIAGNLDDYRTRFGYVPEEPYLYRHLSGAEYLELVGGLRGIPAHKLAGKIDAALQLFGLHGDRDVILDSYSKGMKQKILIAGALLHDPEVLILDEPLSGLDVTAVLIVRHLFAALARRGKIVLYSSHVLEVVEKVCSRVIVLHHGQIVADDAVANLAMLLRLPSLEAIFSQLTEQLDWASAADELVGQLAE